VDAVTVRPETKFARSGDVYVAYQVVGAGALDLVFVMGWVSHLDWFWKEPRFARFLERLASFSRLILFDKRGTGLSDRAVGLPMLEERMDDVRAVMDAAGSHRAALFGVSEGAAMCALFAATYPERTKALVIYGGYARRLWAPDYPWGIPREIWMRFIELIESDLSGDFGLASPASNLLDNEVDRTVAAILDHHGLANRAPSLVHDAHFREWWRTYLRMSASPGAATALTRMNGEIDVREVLPAIRVPTLIVHRDGDQAVSAGNGRYLAARIPGSRYVELPGVDHLPFVGDQEAIVREVEIFLTGTLPIPERDRVLATLLFTGIFGAVATAVRLGDQAWRELVATHDAMVREELARFHGREAKKTINGFLAAFDSPARAIRCAQALVEAARPLGLTLRAGLHVGECDVSGGELGGVALQIAERVYDRAGPGEVVVSSTVTDLVAGSGIAFEELETRLLTGPASGWRLHRVVPASGQASAIPPGFAETVSALPPTALSPREREVAILVARGLTNRQAAEELSISPATVERHVANILAKLGFHSRAQIAAWAVANDLLNAGSV
jgi:pimeloyl-ACP methyl ester carboxylesterase/class 3 adenylate cyclase/DNA-binding CsgD family transcriptional regulator